MRVDVHVAWAGALLWAQAGLAIEFPEHPAVVLNPTELATLRAQVGISRATGGLPASASNWKADLYRAEPHASVMHRASGVRGNAELWLHRDIQIPARGGHYHHFFCDEGDRLEIPANQEFTPGPYKCPRCGREYSGEKYEAAVRRLVHTWLAQAAWDLAVVSVLEERADCAAKSAEILLKYATAYPGPHTSTTKGGMIYQSLCESMWVIPLAQAYDLIYQRLNAQERERIEVFLRTVAAGIQGCGTGGNWGSWHLSAVGVVGFAIHDAGLVEWSLDHFRRQIRDELGDDGLWPESVHTYHYYPLLAFMYLAEAAGHAGIDLYRWEAKPGKSLLSMFTAPLEYAYPDFRLAAINDGWFEAYVPADCYELAYHRTKLPQFAWVIANAYGRGAPGGMVSGAQGSRRAGLYAFLFGADIPEKSQPPAPRSIDFPVLGICMLRSGSGAMMSFDYGPFLGHGQLDKMGVTIFAHDKLWMADYGTPGYGSPILPWYKSTFSHNTVVVDGKSQQRTKENAARLWLGGAEIEAAQATAAEAYPGVFHTRTVVRTPDYFIVLDELQSNENHAYDLYWHGEGELSLDGQILNAASPAKLDPHISDVKVGSSLTSLRGRWQEADSGIVLNVLADGPFVPIAARCPAETGSRSVPLLICRRESQTASFTTVLLPFRGTAHITVRREKDAVIVTTDQFTDTITLPDDDNKPTFSRQGVNR
jgi:hypothetical protein